ncbi:tripartite tricarboxylate transporter TctB family protein [Rhizobium halophilum]|uniref:tripartite tricarboxylate transporter TctB family protein n=1 Tax=Rhizobium halophilum TaxID=2846852 RepID=UPI001EFED1A4|nr:tripartite tricarboxylate transporter TctB family protein [Rhizobium halophilum]MCF6370930.1 tripartite tricarboxylate transporter TctB family protein [Rhizobium halophilum]
MSDRIAGIVMLIVSIAFGITASSYEASFGDPLGPAALPVMLSIPAVLLSLCLVLKPDPDPVWVTGTPLFRQIAAVVLLIAYALLLDPLGFLLATFVTVTLLGRILLSGWLKSALSGVLMTLVLFVTFDTLLGLPLRALPAGLG